MRRLERGFRSRSRTKMPPRSGMSRAPLRCGAQDVTRIRSSAASARHGVPRDARRSSARPRTRPARSAGPRRVTLATETCTQDENGCPRTGPPLSWRALPLPYRFHAPGSDKLDMDGVRDADAASLPGVVERHVQRQAHVAPLRGGRGHPGHASARRRRSRKGLVRNLLPRRHLAVRRRQRVARAHEPEVRQDERLDRLLGDRGEHDGSRVPAERRRGGHRPSGGAHARGRSLHRPRPQPGRRLDHGPELLPVAPTAAERARTRRARSPRTTSPRSARCTRRAASRAFRTRTRARRRRHGELRADVARRSPPRRRFRSRRWRRSACSSCFAHVGEGALARRERSSVRRKGLEPLQELPHWNLNPARLPLPTRQAMQLSQVEDNNTTYCLPLSHLHLKWPNDIFWHDKKLGGILIDVIGEYNGRCAAVIGIGLNVAMPPASGSQIQKPWTDLRTASNRIVSRNQLAGSILNSLITYLMIFEERGVGEFLAHWQNQDYLLGKRVAVKTITKSISGVAQGINDHGHLLLRNDHGELVAIAAGDASVADN